MGLDWVRAGAAAVVLAAAAIGGLAAAQSAPAASFGHYDPPAQFSGSVTHSLYLPMRDGVRLAVSVTTPAVDGKPAPGRFPVIWQHTLGITGPGADGGPLGTGARARGYGGVPSLARYGYVVVQVARRGQGPSFGRRRGYNDRAEAYDAYEVIDWLAAQPWSTGAVGVYGCSNTGDAAMHAVTADNPHLKAAWAGCFSWEKYDGFLRGGVFANWGTGPERTLEQDMSVTGVEGDEGKMLLRQAAEEHQGAFPLRQMWAAMPYRDSWSAATQSRFWYEGSVATYLPQINRSGTAIYVQGGWGDDLRNQGLVAFANLTGERHIVIGPWGHCGNGDFDLLAEVHRFFDQTLKGIDTGLQSQDPVHYFTVNAPAGTEWRSAKAWPVAGALATSFYLGGQGGLAAAPPKGKGPAASFAVRYDVDCPTAKPGPGGLLTGAPPCPLAHGGPRFDGAPLKADTEVTGDAVADLWVASSAPDGNLFVYLEDVAPDGASTPVTDARLRASIRKVAKPPYGNFGLPWQRGHAEDAQPLKAGEPVRMTFAFLPTSYVFKAGHRIRISVAGADYRERDRTPVSPAPQITMLQDAGHRSVVVLPIVQRPGA
jgi:putative CocE/NonD family hydrolase